MATFVVATLLSLLNIFRIVVCHWSSNMLSRCHCRKAFKLSHAQLCFCVWAQCVPFYYAKNLFALKSDRKNVIMGPVNFCNFMHYTLHSRESRFQFSQIKNWHIATAAFGNLNLIFCFVFYFFTRFSRKTALQLNLRYSSWHISRQFFLLLYKVSQSALNYYLNIHV